MAHIDLIIISYPEHLLYGRENIFTPVIARDLHDRAVSCYRHAGAFDCLKFRSFDIEFDKTDIAGFQRINGNDICLPCLLQFCIAVG